MSEYTPYPTVTFAGVNTYDENTISSINIRSGRNNVIEQPQPGYANIQLWTDADTPLDVNLSDSVKVAIQSATYGDGTRTNLITNPSLETNTTGWSGSNVTISQSTSYAKYGVDSLKGVVTTTGTNRYLDYLNTAVPIISGQTYTYSCWVYLPLTNTADISLVLQAYPWNTTGLGAGINLDTKTVTRGIWTRFSGTFTPVNAGGGTPATSCLFRVLNTASWAAGQEIYIDAALLEKSSTLGDYFDGSSKVPIGCAWTGTANASSSTQTGINYQIFTGIISDIDISLDVYGEVGSIARYSITAVGPLSQLQRHTAGANGYAKEFDGTRIVNILTEAFLQQWNEVNPTTTWNDLPIDVTWNSYDGSNIALIDNLSANVDQPGVYELMAYAAAETDAYTLTSDAANSGRGVLWEGADGDLHYDDYNSRALATTLALTGDDISAYGLRSAAQWGEIVNDASVTYRAGTEMARDENSIISYGQLSGTRETQLHNQSDALAQANDFVESRAYPRTYPEMISSPLHSPNMVDLTRDSLISIYNGIRITTDALPRVFGTNFNGFVEGYNWRLTRYTADLSLICSAYSETYLSIIWLQEPPSTTWASYTPTTQQWQEL